MYETLKTAALNLGFDLVGVTAANPPSTFPFFQRWLAAGMHAGMDYLAKNAAARSDPKFVLENVRSILMLGVSYEKVLGNEHNEPGPVVPTPISTLRGIVRYARGVDYHDWIRVRLKTLSKLHRELFPEGRCRGVVDTAPILERQVAVDAGLGRIGKNTMLIHPQLGSTFFLAALLSTEILSGEPSGDFENPCKNCRRCLDACPTGALVEPYVLDARRCINYWTIEHRGEIPSEIAEKMGDRFFGCDTCQNVCPWNRPDSEEGSVDPKSLDRETFENAVRGTPLERRNSWVFENASIHLPSPSGEG